MLDLKIKNLDFLRGLPFLMFSGWEDSAGSDETDGAKWDASSGVFTMPGSAPFGSYYIFSTAVAGAAYLSKTINTIKEMSVDFRFAVAGSFDDVIDILSLVHGSNTLTLTMDADGKIAYAVAGGGPTATLATVHTATVWLHIRVAVKTGANGYLKIWSDPWPTVVANISADFLAATGYTEFRIGGSNGAIATGRGWDHLFLRGR